MAAIGRCGCKGRAAVRALAANGALMSDDGIIVAVFADQEPSSLIDIQWRSHDVLWV